MKRNLLIATRLTVLTLIVLGVAYPLTIMGASYSAFPHAAKGSLVTSEGRIIGSELVGQGFVSERYFHPRPSAAGEGGYDARHSSASNLGPTSRALIDQVTRRVAFVLETEPGTRRGRVPVDLVTSSGSGLDPDISPASAMIQARRVAEVRGLDEASVRELIQQQVRGRQLRFLGEPRVNVLELNLALDALSSQ